MASLASILGTSNIGSGQELVIDMNKQIIMPDKHRNDFMTFQAKIKHSTTNNYEFKGEESPYFEMDDPIRAPAGAGAGAGVAVTLLVTDKTKYHLDYVVAVGGVNCVVDSIAGGATEEVTVSPINAAQTIPATTTADTVEIIGPVKEEGYDLGAARSGLRRTRTNYIQEFSSVFGLTKTMMAVDQYGNMTRVAEETKKHVALARRSIHKTAIYGEKYIDTSGTFDKRYTGGVKGEITTNALEYTKAQITSSDLINITKTMFQHGNKEKYVFVSEDLGGQLQVLLESKYGNTAVTETRLGMEFNTYKNSFGKMYFAVDDTINVGAAGFDGFYVDYEYLTFKTLKGEGLKTSYNVVRDGSNKETAEVSVKYGFDWGYEEAHGKLIGA